MKKTLLAVVTLFGLLAETANANIFFDANGTTAGSGIANLGSYTWEGNRWSTDSSGVAAPTSWDTLVPTLSEAWFPRFTPAAGTTNSYTITVNNNHTIAGALMSVTTGTLLIQGPGILTISNGLQGFFCSPGLMALHCKLTGSGAIICQTGQIFLEGTNDYTGGTQLGTGLINFGNNSAFGTSGITIVTNGSAFISETTGLNIPNDISLLSGLANGSGVNLSTIGTANTTTYSGDWSLGTNSMPIGAGGGTGNTVILSGVISGTTTGSFGRQASTTHGTIILSGANTYPGQTWLRSSVTSVSSLNKVTSGSASSSLGHPTTAALGTIKIGSNTFSATLIYTGAGETSDRVIDLAGTTGSATLQADNPGNLVLTAVNTASGAGAKTLTLTGSGVTTNSIGKIIDNSAANQTSVSKAGTTTWTLSAANTYTGTTTVSAGKLQIGNATALSTNTLTWGGGTIDNTAGSDLSLINNITVNGTATYLGSANALAFSGTATISGASRTISVTANTLTVGSIAQDTSTRNLTKGGNGTLAVTGGCTYSGTTTINSGGTFKLMGSSVLGANNSGIYTNTMSIAGTLDYSSSGSQTLISNFSGAGSILINGPGTLTCAGGLPTFTGTITVNASSLIAGTSTCLPNNCTLNINGGTVNLGANSPTVKILKVAGVEKPAGTYGPIGSSAQHQSALFSGSTGILTVTTGSTSTTAVTSVPNSSLVGQNVTFSITVTGGNGDGSTPDGTVTILDNNVPIGTAPLSGSGTVATATYSTSSLTQGSHPITVSWAGNDSYATSTSSIYTQNVVQPPVITSPAAASTVTANAGTNLLLAVTLQDPAGVTYQWKKGGVNLSNGSYSNAATVIGSTAATLTLVGVKAADASPGDYTCAVTNAAGNALSPTITLVVNDPAISVQPTNSIFECGSNGCLSVTAAGTTNANGVLTYQWYTPNPSGTAIVNATNSTLCFNTVHFSDVGSYSVVVSNGFGNSITSQVAVVTVQDTTKPVLVGVPSDTTADCSAIPSPASVTATDTCDSNPGVNLVTVTNAGSCAQGYAIVRTWTAMDASGNTSSVSQTITVTDTTPPVITLTGGASITHECHTAYVDPGYSANDACAGPVGVTPSGVLDANTLGDYTLTYSASDPCNNGTSLTRVVHVLDTTPPVISLISGTNSLCKHTAYVDPGATATDLCSATVTITTNGVIDTNTPGFYTLTYTAIDASLNSTTSNRVVQVLDCGDPVAITSISTLNSLIVKVPDGTNVEFSVTTTGTDPKTYKWYVKDVRDGGPGTFLFQTISNQVSIGASAVDRTPGTGIVIKTNSYYVVVDNFLTEPQTSGTTNVSIVLDSKPPTLVLTSPAKNGKYGSGTPTLPFKPYAITGTATDPAKGHIAHVRYYYINSNTPPFVPSAIYEAPLVDKNAGTTGDSIVLFNITTNPPLAGTNLIAIWPVDLAGNAGKGVTNAFFYSIPIPFTLHKVGDGTGAVSFVDKMGDKVNTSNIVYFGVGTVDKTVNMNEGETYTLSYTPDRTTNNVKNLPSVISVVTNAPGWGGPTNSIKKYTGPAITVEPTTNSVSFEFDRDRFVDMAGNYNAVLTADTNNPTLGTSRYLHLTVAKSRVATGYLMDAAHVHDAFAVHSSVDSAGHLHLQTALNSIVIDGDLAWTGSENPTGIKQFTGSVTFVNTSNAVVVADLEDKNALPTPGFATMSIPGVNNNPGGSGIATHKLLNGSVTSIYTLGDDDKHPATWPLKGSRSGNIPQWIITKTGVLFGNMNATDGLSNVIAPSLSWIRNPTPVLGYTYANLLPGGFVNSPFAAVASHYDNSVHPGLTGAFTLSLSGGGLANDTNTTLIFSGNTFTTNAPSPVTGGKVDPVSGKLTVIFLDGLPSKHKTTALGVVLQNATNGAGFFIRGATTIPTNSGSLTLTPQ